MTTPRIRWCSVYWADTSETCCKPVPPQHGRRRRIATRELHVNALVTMHVCDQCYTHLITLKQRS